MGWINVANVTDDGVFIPAPESDLTPTEPCCLTGPDTCSECIDENNQPDTECEVNDPCSLDAAFVSNDGCNGQGLITAKPNEQAHHKSKRMKGQTPHGDKPGEYNPLVDAKCLIDHYEVPNDINGSELYYDYKHIFDTGNDEPTERSQENGRVTNDRYASMMQRMVSELIRNIITASIYLSRLLILVQYPSSFSAFMTTPWQKLVPPSKTILTHTLRKAAMG